MGSPSWASPTLYTRVPPASSPLPKHTLTIHAVNMPRDVHPSMGWADCLDACGPAPFELPPALPGSGGHGTVNEP